MPRVSQTPYLTAYKGKREIMPETPKEVTKSFFSVFFKVRDDGYQKMSIKQARILSSIEETQGVIFNKEGKPLGMVSRIYGSPKEDEVFVQFIGSGSYHLLWVSPKGEVKYMRETKPPVGVFTIVSVSLLTPPGKTVQ